MAYEQDRSRDQLRWRFIECECGCIAVRFNADTFGRLKRCSQHPLAISWREMKRQEKLRIWRHRRPVSRADTSAA